MIKCPVCEKEASGLLCRNCGFDGSCDYVRYPTLGAIPEKAASVGGQKAAFEENSQASSRPRADDYASLSAILGQIRDQQTAKTVKPPEPVKPDVSDYFTGLPVAEKIRQEHLTEAEKKATKPKKFILPQKKTQPSAKPKRKLSLEKVVYWLGWGVLACYGILMLSGGITPAVLIFVAITALMQFRLHKRGFDIFSQKKIIRVLLNAVYIIMVCLFLLYAVLGIILIVMAFTEGEADMAAVGLMSSAMSLYYGLWAFGQKYT